jgi:hypothetical protein
MWGEASAKHVGLPHVRLAPGQGHLCPQVVDADRTGGKRNARLSRRRSSFFGEVRLDGLGQASSGICLRVDPIVGAVSVWLRASAGEAYLTRGACHETEVISDQELQGH